MNRNTVSGDQAIEARLRSALRAEADRCAAGEPPRLAAACAAIPRSAPRAAVPHFRAAWIGTGAAVAAAAGIMIVFLPRTVPERPARVFEPVARAATPAEIARLHASVPKLPPVLRPPPPRRLVAVRLPPPGRKVP